MMLKKLIAVTALGACGLAQAAGGPLDGIYACTAAGAQSFITISGQPNGSSVFAVAALTANTNFYGFGTGMATPTNFSGQTMFNLPFSFVAGNGNLNGTIGIVLGGMTVTVPASCQLIW